MKRMGMDLRSECIRLVVHFVWLDILFCINEIEKGSRATNAGGEAGACGPVQGEHAGDRRFWGGLCVQESIPKDTGRAPPLHVPLRP